jgi:hypothetical protein
VRNNSRLIRSLVVVLAAHLLLVPAAPLGAQTFVTPKGEAQNVRFEQRDSGVVEIFYDLISSDARAVYNVVVEGSQDNGASWGMRPKTMTGDVGPGVTPGAGKKIVWDSGKDMERIQFNSLRFRMVATGGPLAANAKPAATAGASPAQAAVNQPSSGGGGSKKKLLIIGGSVLGAGATAAVLLASGKASPPSVTGTSITGNTGTLLAGVAPLTVRVSASGESGETLSASIDFGDGTSASASLSGGEAAVSKTYNTAGTFNPTVTITGKGGTSTGTFPTVNVASLTGRWSATWTNLAGLSATLNLTQSGTSLTGDISISGSNFTNPGRVTGSVAGPASVSFRGTDATGGLFFDFNVTGSGNLSRFEGTATGASTQPWVMQRQ